MPRFSTMALGLTLSISATAMAAGSPSSVAHADLVSADGKTVGTAKFVESATGVTLTISASGLTPGVHGIHLHTTGACDGPEFKTAGAHWNPTHKAHGHEAPQGAHLGDLPNLPIDTNGAGGLSALIEGASLNDGDKALLDADGSALVIHAAPDDNKTDPSGNSGARIACGIVKPG